jgi:hypothetical protein
MYRAMIELFEFLILREKGGEGKISLIARKILKMNMAQQILYHPFPPPSPFFFCSADLFGAFALKKNFLLILPFVNK